MPKGTFCSLPAHPELSSASQVHPKCIRVRFHFQRIPNASQVHLSLLEAWLLKIKSSSASQVHPKCIPLPFDFHCIPSASQVHPKCVLVPFDFHCIPSASQVHPGCIPRAFQMRPRAFRFPMYPKCMMCNV